MSSYTMEGESVHRVYLCTTRALFYTESEFQPDTL